MRRGFTDRRCPKCNGNIFVDQGSQDASEEGFQGWYEWCLQCGYTRYMKPTITLMQELEGKPATQEPARA